MTDILEARQRDTLENWAIAKRELKKLGIAVNTRRKSCYLGCACVEDEWNEKVKGTPHLWQTGKRFSPQHGGYLNHSGLTDTLKIALMRTLAENAIPYEWQHPDRHAILVKLSGEAE